jgi:hypothetical protein
MDQRQTPVLYRIRPAIVAPLLVTAAAICFAVVDSLWWLLGIPFAIVASFCAQPNFNLANGSLAYLAALLGFALFFFHERAGLAISIGSGAGFILSGLEKWFTAKPVDPEDGKSRTRPN